MTIPLIEIPERMKKRPITEYSKRFSEWLVGMKSCEHYGIHIKKDVEKALGDGYYIEAVVMLSSFIESIVKHMLCFELCPNIKKCEEVLIKTLWTNSKKCLSYGLVNIALCEKLIKFTDLRNECLHEAYLKHFIYIGSG